MKEEVVTFETAKLAKKKGFYWTTSLYYNNENIYQYAFPHGERYNNTYEASVFICTCPTQSLLQRWLREVHDIHIVVGTYTHNGKTGLKFEQKQFGATIICEWITDEQMSDNELLFDIYELALEDGLKEGLNLIT